MGHGLVALPRRLWRDADLTGRLQRIQSRAPKMHERLMDAIAELEGLEAQLIRLRPRKHAISRDHQEWIEDLLDRSADPDAYPSVPEPGASSAKIPAVITDRYLAELTRKLNRARHQRVRFLDAWDRLLQDAQDAQAILNASASKRLDWGKGPPPASAGRQWKFPTPYTRYLVYVRFLPALRRGLAAILSLASGFIVWSELVKFVAPGLSVIRLTVVTPRATGGNEVGFVGQVSASVWILYMCTAAVASFEDIKIWGNRALVRRNMYGESATWYSGQIAKLTVPLAYNFVTFLPPDVHRETTFYHFLGRLVNLTPLGKGFDYFFPILILVPVYATLFNLYGRVKSVFGFGVLEDEDDDGNVLGSGTSGWREGRDLIERELSGPSRFGLSRAADGASSLADQPRGVLAPGDPSRRILSRVETTPAAATSNVRPSRYSATEPQQAPRLEAAAPAAEEEDENIFQGFAHRVRNTFERVERPDWIHDLGKWPKWLGEVDGNGESSGRAESGRGMGRWFGGRPADGRLRL